MSQTNTVEQVRDLAAQRSAIRQYRKAARLHTQTGDAFMARGWFEWAGPELLLGDRLASAALLERIDPTPKGLA